MTKIEIATVVIGTALFFGIVLNIIIGFVPILYYRMAMFYPKLWYALKIVIYDIPLNLIGIYCIYRAFVILFT